MKITKTVTSYVDDFDSQTPADQQLRFGFAGQWYVLDLGADNFDRLTAELRHWIKHGRKARDRTVMR